MAFALPPPDAPPSTKKGGHLYVVITGSSMVSAFGSGFGVLGFGVSAVNTLRMSGVVHFRCLPGECLPGAFGILRR